MARNNSVQEPEGTNIFAGASEEESFFPIPAAKKDLSDPTMDPSSPKWNPKKYFDAQPKVIIVIPKDATDLLTDPSGKTPVRVPLGINGYTIWVTKGVPTRVPRDFALLFEDQPGVIQSSIVDAS